MAVAFFNISFSISSSFIFFYGALYSFIEIVSVSKTCIGVRSFTQVEIVPFGTPYSLDNSVIPLPALLRESTIYALNSEWIFDFLP